MNNITITIKLPGILEGPVKHTTFQTGVVDISPIGSKKPQMITKKIKHTDRQQLHATKIIPISASVVAGWLKEIPYWIKPQIWKTLSKQQKIAVYVQRFDEGYGVTFQ